MPRTATVRKGGNTPSQSLKPSKAKITLALGDVVDPQLPTRHEIEAKDRLIEQIRREKLALETDLIRARQTIDLKDRRIARLKDALARLGVTL